MRRSAIPCLSKGSRSGAHCERRVCLIGCQRPRPNVSDHTRVSGSTQVSEKPTQVSKPHPGVQAPNKVSNPRCVADPSTHRCQKPTQCQDPHSDVKDPVHVLQARPLPPVVRDPHPGRLHNGLQITAEVRIFTVSQPGRRTAVQTGCLSNVRANLMETCGINGARRRRMRRLLQTLHFRRELMEFFLNAFNLLFREKQAEF